MSGEFGWVTINGAYVDWVFYQIADAMARDNPSYPPTQAFITFLEALNDVGHDIAYVEAGDTFWQEADIANADKAIAALQAYRASLVETIAKYKEAKG